MTVKEYSPEEARRLIRAGKLDAPDDVLAQLGLTDLSIPTNSTNAKMDTGWAASNLGSKYYAETTLPAIPGRFSSLKDASLRLETMIRLRTKVYNICGLKADGSPMRYKDGSLHNAAQLYDPQYLAMLLGPITAEEAQLRETLKRCYLAEVPGQIREFIGTLKGIGVSQKAPENVARFLGLLGHPICAFPQYPDEHNVLQDGEPFHRRPAQLRQYCGIGRPETHRKADGKLSQAELLAGGKPKLRVALHRIVTGMNGNTPVTVYKELYEAEKAKAVAKGWDQEKWIGTNRACMHGMRLVKKQFLNELYEVSVGTCGC